MYVPPKAYPRALVNPVDDPAGMELFIVVFIIRKKEALKLYSIMTMQVPVHGLTKVAHDVKIVNNPACASTWLNNI